ncbi:hypothetical protein D3C85_1741680 [compost metagenome]
MDGPAVQELVSQPYALRYPFAVPHQRPVIDAAHIFHQYTDLCAFFRNIEYDRFRSRPSLHNAFVFSIHIDKGTISHVLYDEFVRETRSAHSG